MQVLIHLQRGKADIDAVQEAEEVAQHQEGHETPRHFAHCTLLKRIHCATYLHGYEFYYESVFLFR
jgi:hypothetical protein